ncbi:uncharacterized protein LOC110747090 isoform X3 [Prunus avium]|uniref:Uncharacterized protein LOC110747090 isoform X3 n=1 Tax=Prunus avium TaxID=42229 RepID=A0A6P5RJR8_PRUAV|nr:uncharacterized protein LOC110747090 isoform X3 [Prunus avium]
MASLSQSASLFVSFFFSFDTKKECEMLDYYEQLAASPYNDSLKVLEADIQHANMLSLNCLLLNVMQLLEANCFEGEGCVTVPKVGALEEAVKYGRMELAKFFGLPVFEDLVQGTNSRPLS